MVGDQLYCCKTLAHHVLCNKTKKRKEIKQSCLSKIMLHQHELFDICWLVFFVFLFFGALVWGQLGFRKIGICKNNKIIKAMPFMVHHHSSLFKVDIVCRSGRV